MKTDNSGREVRWPPNKPITVCWKGNPLRQADVRAALDVWTSTSASLEFVLTTDSQTSCEITIRMAPVLEIRGAMGETTITVDPRTGFIRHSVITLNERTLWSAASMSPCSGENDFQTVLAHEVGHAIGFDDLDNVKFPDELMRSHRGAGNVHRYLGIGDTLGRNYLYPLQEEGTEMGGGCACLAAPMRKQGLGSIVTTFILAGWLYRRRQIGVRKT